MKHTPKSQAKPQVSFIVYKGDGKDAKKLGKDLGPSLDSLEVQAMANGGYTIRGRFYDPNFNSYNKLIEDGYFKNARKEPMKVQAILRWSGEKNTAPKSATKPIVGFIISLEAQQPRSSDANMLEFVAIDPPSWYLNAGDASGKCYTGNVGSVIEQVVKDYSPKDRLIVNVATTIDSKQGKWWLMRQDPKTFIASLFDWSSSLTEDKTQWIFSPQNYELTIKPQGKLSSESRAYYSFQQNKSTDPIIKVEMLSDNALSAVQTKLITHGLSTIAGQYLDSITAQPAVEILDSNTTTKRIASVKSGRAFDKPPKGDPPNVGYTSIMSIPEIGSAGDIGLPYKDYIDGRARAMYLNMVNALMRAKVTVIGDGTWDGCNGLGIDTIFLDWRAANKANKSGNSGINHWYSGKWLVYGFYHHITQKTWTTDVYCARYDHDSDAVKV